MIGIILLVIAGIMIYISLSQPRIYEEDATVTAGVTSATQSTLPTAASTAASPKVTYPLNLNTATFEELMTNDGLGAARANAIIDYRNALGGYTEVSQIMEIKGIGDALYRQVAPYLTV